MSQDRPTKSSRGKSQNTRKSEFLEEVAIEAWVRRSRAGGWLHAWRKLNSKVKSQNLMRGERARLSVSFSRWGNVRSSNSSSSWEQMEGKKEKEERQKKIKSYYEEIRDSSCSLSREGPKALEQVGYVRGVFFSERENERGIMNSDVEAFSRKQGWWASILLQQFFFAFLLLLLLLLHCLRSTRATRYNLPVCLSVCPDVRRMSFKWKRG